jgi:hypothetical protein
MKKYFLPNRIILPPLSGTFFLLRNNATDKTSLSGKDILETPRLLKQKGSMQCGGPIVSTEMLFKS